MNIARIIERSRRLFPDKPALIFEDQSFSYQELDERVNRMANGLRKLGVSRHDRVALFLPNMPTFIIAFFGIQKLGAIAVAINPTLKAEEAKFILHDSAAVALVTTDEHKYGRDLPHLNHLLIADQMAHGESAGFDASMAMGLHELMVNASPDAQAVQMADNEPAAILYTSGTTGFTKGATLSHGNFWSNARTSVDAFQMQPKARVMLFLPAFHSFGLTAAVNSTFESGATLILHRKFDLEQVLDSISVNQVTMLFGVPTHYLLLYDKGTVDVMRSVRCFISAGANLPVALSSKWSKKYGRSINEGYGLTETSMICFNQLLNHIPWGSIGTPLTNVELKVVDNNDQEVAPGELGEIVVRSPTVMLGYWNRTAESAVALRGGWFHTGDIGRMDEEGYFYIVDRVKDMVNVGGLKVYPSEVENVLYQHPAIAEVAVYGVQNPVMGEQVRANIVLKAGQLVSAEAILTFSRQRLADFKVPSVVEFVEALPKSGSGKILKRVLREQVQAKSKNEQIPPSSLSLSKQEIEDWLVDWLSEKLDLEAELIATDRPLVDYGLTSILAVNFAQELGKWLGRSIAPIVAWNLPTLGALIPYLMSSLEAQETEHTNDYDKKDALTMLPDSDNNQLEFWPAIEGYLVYDALMYDRMTNDEQRNQSYRVAFDQTVKDKVVVEIGTGKNAILARLCVEAGASKVYAIEIGEQAYRLARAQVAELGLSDQIEVIHSDATKANLPELADVCVSEIVGGIGGSQGAAVILNHARRFLKPSGLMIPERSITKIVAVGLPAAALESPQFPPLARHYTKKIFEQVGHPFDVRLCLNNFSRSYVLSDSDVFEDLDFTQPVPTESQREIKLTIDPDSPDSRWDGFLVWLNLHTIKGEVIDILENSTSWLPIYFPIFSPGVPVSSGDVIHALCSVTLCDNNLNPDYKIEGRLIRTNGEILAFRYASYRQRPYFKHNPFYERLFTQNEQFDGPSDILGQFGKESPSSSFSSSSVHPISKGSELSTLSDAELMELLASEIAAAKERSV